MMRLMVKWGGVDEVRSVKSHPFAKIMSTVMVIKEVDFFISKGWGYKGMLL